MPEKLIVFAPAGNVGRHILPHVIGNPKFNVRLVYHKTRPPQCDEPGVDAVQASLFDLEAVKTALTWDPHRIVFMVPAQAGTVQMAENFVTACKDVAPDVKQIVYVSEDDADEYMREHSEFYKEGAQTIKLVLDSGLPVTRLEPTCFMQNLEIMLGIPEALAQGTETLGTAIEATNHFSLVDTRDIGEAVAKMLERESAQEVGKHYRLVGDFCNMEKAVSLLLKVLKEGTSQPAVPYPEQFYYKEKSKEELSGVLQGIGWPADLASEVAFIFSGYHEKHLAIVGLSSSADLKDLLGHEPISLEQYLTDTRAVWEGAWARDRAE